MDAAGEGRVVADDNLPGGCGGGEAGLEPQGLLGGGTGALKPGGAGLVKWGSGWGGQAGAQMLAHTERHHLKCVIVESLTPFFPPATCMAPPAPLGSLVFIGVAAQREQVDIVQDHIIGAPPPNRHVLEVGIEVASAPVPPVVVPRTREEAVDVVGGARGVVGGQGPHEGAIVLANVLVDGVCAPGCNGHAHGGQDVSGGLSGHWA